MKNLRKSFLVVLTSVAMIACGENKEEDKEKITIGDGPAQSGSSAAEEKVADVEDSDADIVEVTITGNDQMQFSLDEIRVKAGQTVRLTLEHVGSMPKNAMGHNWVLLTQGTSVNEFGQAAAGAADDDYIPNEDQVIAHTELLGGGESDTIEFEAPEEGTYDFICSFPGHYGLMQGKFIVE